MPRLRLGVVLLVPHPWDGEIDGLRRALGHDALGRVPPHLTLVPPVNVRDEDLPSALSVLRRAAAATLPFTLRLGPVTTFHPVSPVGYLAVGGDLDALHALRDAVFVPPLERPLTHPFVPHVTVVEEAPTERLVAAITALADYEVPITVEGVHLLQETRDASGTRRWVPIADARLGSPSVCGRGGFEVVLTDSEQPDPDARHALGLDVPPVPAGGRPFTVTARRDERPVGLATGWSRGDESVLAALAVTPDHRGYGVAGHVVRAVEQRARAEGRVLVSAPRCGPPVEDLLLHLGWAEAAPGTGALRRWVGDAGRR